MSKRRKMWIQQQISKLVGNALDLAHGARSLPAGKKLQLINFQYEKKKTFEKALMTDAKKEVSTFYCLIVIRQHNHVQTSGSQAYTYICHYCFISLMTSLAVPTIVKFCRNVIYKY